MQSNNLNENIKHNDLEDLISNVVSIDQFKSKLGDDDKVVVIAFEISDKDPAQDLSQFLETGHDALDVDISPGPNDEGKYKVFIELERNQKLFSRIEKILNDVMRVDNQISSFKFTSYKNTMPADWSEEEFNNRVITSSYEYLISNDPEKAQIAERMKFLKNY